MSDPTRLILPDDDVAIAAVDAIEYAHPAPAIVSSYLFDHQQGQVGLAQRKTEPIGANAHRDYHAAHFSGRRPLSAIHGELIHSTESDPGSAPAIARYFSSPKAGGSTQLIHDDLGSYRTLRDDEIPWGAMGANYRFRHHEQCGRARWAAILWSRAHRRTMLRTASKVAHGLRLYGNPPVWLDVGGLRAGARGVSDHATATKAFGGSHWDPGPGYPRRLFMTFVKGYYYGVHRKVKRLV